MAAVTGKRAVLDGCELAKLMTRRKRCHGIESTRGQGSIDQKRPAREINVVAVDDVDCAASGAVNILLHCLRAGRAREVEIAVDRECVWEVGIWVDRLDRAKARYRVYDVNSADNRPVATQDSATNVDG